MAKHSTNGFFIKVRHLKHSSMIEYLNPNWIMQETEKNNWNLT